MSEKEGREGEREDTEKVKGEGGWGRNGILKSSSLNRTKLCWDWSLEQMGKEKLDVCCGRGRKMSCCP